MSSTRHIVIGLIPPALIGVIFSLPAKWGSVYAFLLWDLDCENNETQIKIGVNKAGRIRDLAAVSSHYTKKLMSEEYSYS